MLIIGEIVAGTGEGKHGNAVFSAQFFYKSKNSLNIVYSLKNKQ